MLYWAEGAKEKEGGRPTGIKFSNSDPRMIKLFLKWLQEICEIPENSIKYELYIHVNSRARIDLVKKFWAKQLNIGQDSLQSVYYKKHKILTNRKKVSADYFGLLMVKVCKSTNLNRKVAGWIQGICDRQWGIV